MTQVFLDSGSTSPWTVVGGFNDANNTVELLGPGGTGGVGQQATSRRGGGGGGGGAYRKRSNLALVSLGSVPFRAPAKGVQSTTRFGNNGATGTNYFGAQFGVTGATGVAGGTGGAGGSATEETGGTPPGSSATGNAGGTGGLGGGVAGGGGGGGAGQAAGAGQLGSGGGGTQTGGGGGGVGGGTAGAIPNGGNGDGGSGGGVGGNPAAAGTAGTGGGGGGSTGTGTGSVNVVGGAGAIRTSTGNWDATHGPGGGGGGGGDNGATGGQTGNNTGGDGGIYGGGGGGGGGKRSAGGSMAGGLGGGGLIAITWTSSSGVGAAAGVGTASGSRYLLDEVGVTAARAYSTRKLRAAYAGSAMRVRRSSDDAEQDIGFSSAGDLDTTALLSFVGANSGYVVTWYDQSGTADNATQATNAKQQRIVNAGTVETRNGKPAINFLGVYDSRLTTSVSITHREALAVAASTLTTGWSGGYPGIFSIATDNNGLSGAGGFDLDGLGSETYNTIVIDGQGNAQAFGGTLFQVNAYGYVLGTTVNPIHIGVERFGTREWAGWIAEIVLTPDLTSGQRAAAYNNQREYWKTGAGYGSAAGTGAASASSFYGVIDKVGVAAARAYSTRRLRGGYTGAAIRVRRSSDNAEQDIGFVGENLDTASLLSFVGANSGFIAKWYDQSGNGDDAVQTTASMQPRIVLAGVLSTRNSQAAPFFDGGGQFVGMQMPTTSSVSAAEASAVAATAVGQTGPVWGGYVSLLGAAGGQNFIVTDGPLIGFIGGFGSPTESVNNGPDLNPWSGELFQVEAYGSAVSQTLILGYGSGPYSWGGWIGEAVLFASALSSGNRTTLFNDQAIYWALPTQANSAAVGVGAAAAVGAAVYASVGAAAGTSTAAATGVAITFAPAVGAAAGTGAAAATGGAIVAAVGAAAGVGTAAATDYLLDVVGGVAASRAYSTRRLRAAYAGSAIRVRRSSDNAEQDIGFVGENLDTAALATFVGANSAFVTKWYDQSGHADDAVQATASRQPRIVLAGVIDTRSGLPAPVFDPTISTGTLLIGTSSSAQQAFDIAAVVGTTDAASPWDDYYIHTGSTGGTFGLVSDPFFIDAYYLLQGSIFDTAYVDGGGGNHAVFGGVLHQVHISCPPAGGGSNFNQIFLGTNFGTAGWPGWIGETIVWASGITTGQRTAVHHNQRRYWKTAEASLAAAAGTGAAAAGGTGIASAVGAAAGAGSANAAGRDAAHWTPADLGSALRLWLRADVGITLNGSDVSGWTDLSGNGCHVSQPLGAQQPAFQATGFNGLPTVLFTAANFDRVYSNAGALTLGNATLSTFLVGQMLTGTDALGRALSFRATGQSLDDDNAGSFFVGRDNGGNAVRFHRSSASVAAQALSLATSKRIGFVADGANATPYLDNVAGTTGATSGSFAADGRVAVGGAIQGAPGTFWDGPISEVVVTNTALSSTDRANLDAYFVALWFPAVATAGVGAAAGVGTGAAVGTGIFAGVGAAAGTGTAAATGRATLPAVAAATGTGAASAVGAATVASVGSAVGAGVGTGIGASTAASVGAAVGIGVAVGLGEGGALGLAAGVGVATGVGRATVASLAAATGVGTATGIGQGIGIGVGNAGGLGAANGVGARNVASVGAATGAGAASGVGSSIAASVGAATGIGAANGLGAGGALAAAAGVGVATGVGSATAASVGAATGVGVATGVGRATGIAVASATGVGAASAVGSSTAASVGAAAGLGAATGFGSGGSLATAAGIGAAQATGLAIFTAVGAASGAGAAAGVGRGINGGIAAATGVGAASAVATSVAASVGNAAGVGVGIGQSENASKGTAVGVGTAAAVGSSIGAGVGTAAGIGAASAVAIRTATSVGAASGVGVGSGTGRSTATSLGAAAGISQGAALGVGAKAAVGSAAGLSLALGVGTTVRLAVGSAQGVGAALGIALGSGAGVTTAPGFGVAAAVGASTAASVGTAAGSSTGYAISIDVIPFSYGQELRGIIADKRYLRGEAF